MWSGFLSHNILCFEDQTWWYDQNSEELFLPSTSLKPPLKFASDHSTFLKLLLFTGKITGFRRDCKKFNVLESNGNFPEISSVSKKAAGMNDHEQYHSSYKRHFLVAMFSTSKVKRNNIMFIAFFYMFLHRLLQWQTFSILISLPNVQSYSTFFDKHGFLNHNCMIYNRIHLFSDHFSENSDECCHRQLK